MKEFSLEEYLKNPSRKIVTRDGKSVRIICTDKRNSIYPIIALCLMEDGSERLSSYSPNGKECLSKDSCLDLFFVPEKHEFIKVMPTIILVVRFFISQKAKQKNVS